ncbi:hypothetical protein C8R43DRAFT_1138368 [Mycena crocata]|nr:hypothetical protein C8R43DRAFT_1138368 [Mycena crocata]
MFLDDPVHVTAQDFTSTPNVDLLAFRYFESAPQPFVSTVFRGHGCRLVESYTAPRASPPSAAASIVATIRALLKISGR